MQITFGPQNDHCRFLDENGAYEWWYIDALSPNGEWGVVVIVFRGMPMSPDYLAAQSRGTNPSDHCGYTVSIYHHGKRIYFAFRGINEPDLSNANINIDLNDIGHFNANSIEVNTSIPSLRRSATIKITTSQAAGPSQSEAPSQAAGPSQSEAPSGHGWSLTAPRTPCAVRLVIREDGVDRADAEWEGVAYRDHNWGQRAMQADFHHWYWGRVHGANRTIVYLAAPSDASTNAWAGEVDVTGKITPWTNVVVAPSHHRPTMLGLWAPKTVKVTGTDAEGRAVTVISTHDEVVEDGPFYQRYLSRWNVNGADLGVGTSEYMNVARYKRAWIRPFLRLPWFRHE